MTKTTIKQEFITRMKLDEDLKLKLAKANGVRIPTVYRWLLASPHGVTLTTYDNMKILKEHFGLQEVDELLEKESIVEEAAK